MKKLFLLVSIVLFFIIAYCNKPKQILAYAPASTHYIMVDYGFGSGGTATSSSTNYSLFGLSGENTNDTLSSANYKALSGLTYTIIASVPAAQTFTNPSNYYNKLKIVLNQSKDPSDFS